VPHDNPRRVTRRSRRGTRPGHVHPPAPRAHDAPSSARGPWNPPPSAALAIALIAALLAVYRSADPDFWFHLAAGRSIVTNGLPRREAWCLAAWGDTPWIPEWIFHVALYLARRWGGDAAIALWRAALAGGAVLLTLRLARVVGGYAWPALLVAPLALAVQRPRMVARGEQWMAVLLLVSLLSFERARRGARDRTAWLLPLQVLWANAHPSWILGPAVAALYAGCEFVQARRAGRRLDRAWRWALVAAGLIGASALTPDPTITFGEPLRLLFDVRGDLMTRSIDELQPWSWGSDRGDPFTAFLGLCLLAGAIGGPRAFRSSPPLLIMAVATLAMALGANRFRPLPTLVAWPVLVVALRPDLARGRGLLAGAAACGAALAGVFFLARDRSGAEPGVSPQWRAFPVEAVALADSLELEGPVLNTFEYGGYILWARGERHPPLVDGRARGSPAFRSRFAHAMSDSAAHDTLLSMWPFTHAIVRPPRAREDYLAVGLSRRPDWALIFADDAASLFVERSRTGALAERLAYRWWTPDYPVLARLCYQARSDSALARSFEAELQRARVESPWHGRASYWLGMLRLTLGRPRETLVLLDEAERIRPTLPGLSLARGIAWGMLGDGAASRGWLERAVREPESALKARELLREMR
jgi:hypothetical protein